MKKKLNLLTNVWIWCKVTTISISSQEISQLLLQLVVTLAPKGDKSGRHDHEGMERIELPDGMLKVKTLNLNAFYVFNSHRFSYPAAFSQSYIQRLSAGSFLLAASGMGQHATLDWDQEMKLKMTNIGLGAGYGYNYVPGQGWLLHISGLPTFIVYSNTSKDNLTVQNNKWRIRTFFGLRLGKRWLFWNWNNQ